MQVPILVFMLATDVSSQSPELHTILVHTVHIALLPRNVGNSSADQLEARTSNQINRCLPDLHESASANTNGSAQQGNLFSAILYSQHVEKAEVVITTLSGPEPSVARAKMFY